MAEHVGDGKTVSHKLYRKYRRLAGCGNYMESTAGLPAVEIIWKVPPVLRL